MKEQVFQKYIEKEHQMKAWTHIQEGVFPLCPNDR